MSIPQMMRAVTIDGFGEPNVFERRFPLERALEAHALGEAGHIRGRIVFDVSDSGES